MPHVHMACALWDFAHTAIAVTHTVVKIEKAARWFQACYQPANVRNVGGTITARGLIRSNLNEAESLVRDQSWWTLPIRRRKSHQERLYVP
ncbi:hypothetical protein BC835DRAFT_585958 [Cytidiella melzeri]|nr:hypothetical protein BC835DRAFT_585958 [Cytidiella melzeri]